MEKDGVKWALTDKKLGELSKSVEINIEPYMDENDKLVVIGTTNLPKNTLLMCSVEEKGGDYYASDKATVNEGGQFEGGPFSKRGAPITAGEYEIEVNSVAALVQPADVKKIIGQNGEKLKGKLVERDDYTLAIKTIIFSVGTFKEKLAQEERKIATNQKYQSVYEGMKQLFEQQKSFCTKNNSDAEWGKFIRTYQKDLDLLRKEVENAPVQSTGAPLRGAGSALSILPTSTPFAPINDNRNTYQELTNQVVSFLNEANKRLGNREKLKPVSRNDIKTNSTPSTRVAEPGDIFQVMKSTSLRKATTSSSKVLNRLKKGDRVMLLEKTTKYWYEVIFDDDKRGFVKAGVLEYIDRGF